ncbi:hypothetical protein FN3523_1081 [Francisella hispaniensis]|uniref:Uncharacterized protein n=1 Tax=Francisella hispaniensis TaxID=622488 RepID=F4BFZ0_9GAMM|nr:hypothetical protein FN3523_1081 [Francisella hispaniensis]
MSISHTPALVSIFVVSEQLNNNKQNRVTTKYLKPSFINIILA